MGARLTAGLWLLWSGVVMPGSKSMLAGYQQGYQQKKRGYQQVGERVNLEGIDNHRD